MPRESRVSVIVLVLVVLNTSLAIRLKVRDGDKVSMLVQDSRLRWPDTFALGPDGAVYVTASHIMDMNWFKPDNPASLKTTLFKIETQR